MWLARLLNKLKIALTCPSNKEDILGVASGWRCAISDCKACHEEAKNLQKGINLYE